MNPVRSLSEAFTQKNYSKCKQIIDSINIASIDKKMIRGFISLTLRYFYTIEDFKEFEIIVNSGYDLMKRDYMLYCKYLYRSNIKKSVEIFFKNILSQENIQQSDIDFLIDNNFTEIIKTLNGYYVICSKKSNVFDFSKLKKFDNIHRESEIIIHFISLIQEKSLPTFCLDPFIEKIKTSDVIIDGGNVLFSRKNKSIENLNNIIQLSLRKFKSPVIILHQRHKKFLDKNNFSKICENYIYFTPYDIYDDYFLILGMIINKIPIITNDKFRDHIFEVFKIFDTKNNQISNYIKEMILSYNHTRIENMKIFSNCIQFDDNHIYVPSVDGFFQISI